MGVPAGDVIVNGVTEDGRSVACTGDWSLSESNRGAEETKRRGESSAVRCCCVSVDFASETAAAKRLGNGVYALPGVSGSTGTDVKAMLMAGSDTFAMVRVRHHKSS